MNELNNGNDLVVDCFALIGCQNGERWPLNKEILTVGRVKEMDVFIDRKAVSRHHATLTYEKGTWYVKDEGSTNMTRVNNAFVFPGQNYPLNPGDTVAFGSEEFIFVRKEESAALAEQREEAVAEPVQEQFDENSLHTLQDAIRTFVTSGYRDNAAYYAIVDALSEAPLYAPVSREEGTVRLLTLRLQDGKNIVPLYTGEDEAAKAGGTPVERFAARTLMPMLAEQGMAAVINLFSEFRFMVSFELLTGTILPAVAEKNPVKPEPAPEPEPIPEPEPEPIPEPEPEPIPEPEPEPIPEPEPEPIPEPEPEPIPEPEPEPIPEPEPEPIPEPEPEPIPEPVPVPAPEPRVFRPPVGGPVPVITHEEKTTEPEKKPEEPKEKLVAGKYRLLNVVNAAGLVKTAVAEQVSDGKTVLLEMCDKTDNRFSEEFRAFFMNGRNAMYRLKQPVLAQILEIMESDRAICVVRERLEGGNMIDKVAAEGMQPVADVVAWGKQLCFALQYLHSREPAYIYGNLKPTNLVLTSDCGHIKLAGLEEVVCRGEGRVAVYGEGVRFAAPEAFDGAVDVRTDVFGLGMNLRYMLTGEDSAPDQLQPISAVREDVPAELERILSKCVSADPEERYSDIMELLFELDMLKF